jgi:hypothetical protein
MANPTDEEKPDQEAEPDVEYTPDIRDARTGLMCWRDSKLACGGFCMAYVTHPRRSNSSELGEQQTHCSLLTSAERLGRNTTILADMLTRAERKRRSEEADRKRTEQFAQIDPNRSPFGGKKE